MWIYVAFGVGILVAVNALIVIAVRFVAQRTHADPSVEELDAEARALLLSHVRPLRRDDVDGDQHREAA